MAPEPVDGIPPEVRRLAEARARARTEKDFARADELRDQIEAAGYTVLDGPAGSELTRRPIDAVDPASIENVLDRPPELAFSVHLLYEGFIGDLDRFLASFGAHHDALRVEVVVVDPARADAGALDERARAYPFLRIVHLDRPVGWAAARNAGLKSSKGAIIVLADLSIQAEGDLLGPIEAAMADPEVGVAGPFGLVTDDLRDFREDPGPFVDAIEGYLLAVRRGILAAGLIDERFAWYRNADIDLSFQVRAGGYRARVVPLPVSRHVHRGWTEMAPDERARRSRKNHRIFLGRWEGSGLRR